MLKEKLQLEQREALKAGDIKKRMVLGMVLNSIKNRELNKRAESGRVEELANEEIMGVIASEVKKRKESIESFKAGGREELAQSEKEELDILMTYMPKQMSEEAIREEIKKTIAEIGAKGIKEMGRAIGAVMAKIKGKADGTLVSRIVKEELVR